MLPKRSRSARVAQEGPNRAPRWTQQGELELPFRAIRPKITPEAANRPPRGPQGAPRRPQNGSQEAPKMPPGGPRRPLGCPQETPKRLPTEFRETSTETPRCVYEASGPQLRHIPLIDPGPPSGRLRGPRIWRFRVWGFGRFRFFGFPTLQDGPRGPQGRLNDAQEAPKTAPGRPKRA